MKINKDSFFAVNNNNKSPIGGASLWSGMMLIGNIIYTCSSGHPILYSELPLYDEPSKYNSLLKNKYFIQNGDAEFFGNKIITKGKNNIIICKDLKLNSSINIYSNIIANSLCEYGLIFGFNTSTNIDNYFIFMINKEGFLYLKKKNKNIIKNLFPENDIIHQNYNKENVYKMNIKYNFSSNEVKTYINEIEIFKLSDNSLIYSKIGFFSSDNGTIFTQLLTEQNKNNKNKMILK